MVFRERIDMLYLVIAVVMSSLVAIIMRLSEKHVTNNFAMFSANYFVCALIAFLFAKNKNVFAPHDGLTFALLLGLVSGCLYLVSFMLLKRSISKNGVVLASVFMKLGVLIPAIMAIVFFGEAPTWLQITGFVLAAAAILVIYLEPGADKRAHGSAFIWLILLLIVSGLTESMANIYENLGDPGIKDNFLFFNFAVALLLALSVTLIKRDPVTPKDVLFGVLIGVPNYFCTRFLLLSLGQLPAVVVYPIYNVGAIILIGLAGIFLFKEKLGARKAIGYGLIIAALVLLNI